MYFSVFKGEHPSALNVLMQGVNGQKFTFDEYESCMTCGELKAERKCSACRMVCTIGAWMRENLSLGFTT